MAKKRENKFLSFIVVVVLIVFAGVIYIVVSSGNLYKNTPNNQQPSSQIYKSKNLKFSISVSANWQVQEDITFVDLISNKGKINISRIATNFNSVKDYLQDFDLKRSISIKKENEIKINNKESISRIEIFNGGPINKQKVYYVYTDNWVYAISTTPESLFDDLDKIAQSFKYGP